MNAEKTLTPSNVSVEKYVLGAALESELVFKSAIAAGLQADDFSLSDHERAFRSMVEMDAKGIPVDSLSLSEYLGGSQWDAMLTAQLVSGAVVHLAHALHHIGIVKSKARLREIIRISDWLTQAAIAPGADPAQIVKVALDRLRAVRTEVTA